MTTSKSLPTRPSLESLRKQAKKLARDVAAGHADAIARARLHLPHVDQPITQRNAQLVIAREYGFAGWQDLIAEVSKRLGRGLEWAAAQARRAIHDNDVERLKQLLAEYRRCCPGKAPNGTVKAACWESRRAPMPTQETRRENSGSRAGRAPNC